MQRNKMRKLVRNHLANLPEQYLREGLNLMQNPTTRRRIEARARRAGAGK